MAELPAGKQPAKRLKPSRLKYQVRSESTDDEKLSEAGPVQAPDSQTVIPETQLEHHLDHKPKHGDPLSPSSAALLDRNTHKKSSQMIDSTSFPVRLFSKEPFFNGSSLGPVSSVGFSFGQPKKAASKTPPNVEAAPLLPAGPPTADSRKSEPAKSSPSLSNLPPIVTTDSVLSHSREVEQHCAKEVSAPNSQASGVEESVRDDIDQRNELHDAYSDHPPSTEPINAPAGATKQMRKKQSKKGKKGIVGPPRGVPWPPRSSVTVPDTVDASPADQAVVPQRSAVHGASPPTEPESRKTLKILDERMPVPEVAFVPQGPMIDHVIHHPGDVEAQQDHLDEQESNATFPAVQQVTSRKPDASPEHILCENLNERKISRAQPSLPLEPPTSANFVAGDQTLVGSNVTLEQNDRQPCAAGRTKAAQSTLQRDAHNDVPERPSADNQLHSPHSRKIAVWKECVPQPGDHLPRPANSQNRPYRVEKVQKKRRVSAGSQQPTSMTLSRSCGTLAQDDFDKMVEGLREAHHAQKSQKDDDLTTQTKHFEEVKALLHDQLNQCSITIAEWKEKYDTLHHSTEQLRERAKSSQKYVSGLQTDHEKLQRSAVIYREECKKVLQQKIAEVENEKQSLQRELEATLDSLVKGQRTLKNTVDEVYVRYIISESKRKDLAENLAKQITLYEEEKTRRKDLETKLWPSFQNLHCQLENRSAQLIEKLEGLQSSVDGVACELGQDSRIQECLRALRKVQDVPLLTTKDVQKAEGMLRFIHDGLCSKLDSVVQSVDAKVYTTKELEMSVGKQLQDLRSEMLRFDTLAVECRQAKESRDDLKRELEVERDQLQRLHEQSTTARQREDDLESQKKQIERQLADIDANARLLNSNSRIDEQDMTDLQDKIKEVEDECSVAKAEVERLQRKVEKRDRKLSDYEACGIFADASVSILKEESQTLLERLKQKVKPPDITQLRHDVEKEIQQGFTEKESDYRNSIHQLTTEQAELQVLVQQHDEEIRAAKERCEEAKKGVSDTMAELEFTRQEKAELEAKCRNLQRVTLNRPSNGSEISNLGERLHQKSEELRSNTEELAELQRAFAQLESSKTNLQVSCEQQQAEISQHSSSVESLRQETDLERQEEQRCYQSAIQLAQKKTNALNKEKEDLQAKLDQVLVHGTKLTNAQAALILERDDLRHRNTKLEAGKQDDAAQLLRLQEEHAEKLHRYEENVDSLQRHQQHLDSACKEAEAKIQLQKTEHLKKIEFDRQKYESIVKGLQQELDQIRVAKLSRPIDRQDRSPSQDSSDTFTRALHNINTGKSRKKVNRGNHSVLNVTGTPGTLVETFSQHPPTSRRVLVREHSDTLFDEVFQDNPDRLMDEHGISVVEPVAENVEDTQEIADTLMAFEDDLEEVPTVFPNKSQYRILHTTDQSSLSASLSSDELNQLREESQDARRLSTPVLQGGVHISDLQRSSQDCVPETPRGLGYASGSSFGASQSGDRPKSQANTASRLMPPPGNKSHHQDQHKISPGRGSKPVSSRSTNRSEHVAKTSIEKRAMTAHQSTSSKQSRALRALALTGRERSAHAISASGHKQGHKRQSTLDQDESHKRQRTSSQSLHAHSSSGSSSHTSHQSRPSPSPGMSSQSRAQPSSSIVTRRPSSLVASSSTRPLTRSRQASASRSSATTPANHTCGRHQTRSKSKRPLSVLKDPTLTAFRQAQELERFEQELRGG